MVAFSSLIVALFAIAESLASPTQPVNKGVTERSPKDFVLRKNAIHRRSTVDYDQDYTTGGTVDYSPDGDFFEVEWDTEDDFVVGVGWSTGSTE